MIFFWLSGRVSWRAKKMAETGKNAAMFSLVTIMLENYDLVRVDVVQVYAANVYEPRSQ